MGRPAPRQEWHKNGLSSECSKVSAHQCRAGESWNHSDQKRLLGSSSPTSTPSPCTHPMILSATSPQFLNTSRDGDSPTSLGSLCHCLTALLEDKCVLIPNLNLPWHNLKLSPLVLSLCQWRRVTATTAETWHPLPRCAHVPWAGSGQ